MDRNQVIESTIAITGVIESLKERASAITGASGSAQEKCDMAVQAVDLGHVREELQTRALTLDTVIGMLSDCEAALTQMANDGPQGFGDPVELSRADVRTAVRRLRHEATKRAAAAGLYMVDPMTGARS